MTQVNRQMELKAASFLGSAPRVAVSGGFMVTDAAGLADRFAGSPAVTRKRIWDLAGHYHCSIIGTCLSTAELRKVLTKLDLATEADCDHDLHGRGVGLASRQDLGGKLLNKALDDRHQATLKRYARAKSAEAVRGLWREDVKSGDIPGGYWAVLTHPAASPELVREAFGYVHMLSHLVGAANRADIRRLQGLEARNGELAETIERQQVKLREMALERDATVRQLQRELAGRAGLERADGAADEETGLRAVIADLRRRLEGETRRRVGVEGRLTRARAEIAEARRAAGQAERLADALRAEIEAVERGLAPGDAEDGATRPAAVDLGGRTVLYVGGRPAQLAHLRQAAAARGARFLHHDGGIEDNGVMLAGLVRRADLVLFPVDCVSHAASGTVKRACRNEGKTYLPLRSAAVTSFIAALSGSF